MSAVAANYTNYRQIKGIGKILALVENMSDDNFVKLQQNERLLQLNKVAITQMRSLLESSAIRKLQK